MAVGRLALVAALVVTGTALGAGSSGSWRPHVCAAERYAAQRHGVIAFAVRTRTRSWGWHRTTTFPSASVVKAMLLVAYLDTPSVRGRRLRTITPVQRWGIARVRPSGWRLYFKGGWTESPGWVDHQVALLTRGHERVAVAILTYHGGDHAYGRRTLRGIAARLLRG